MVDLALSDDEKEIRSWVRTFVTKELLPLEPDALARERRGERGLPLEELRRLQDVAKQAGFFGIQTPEAYGGMGLSAVMTALVEIELGRSFLQFAFAGAADNILYDANEAQQEALPASDDLRRAEVVLRDHRARSGVGRAGHPDQRPARG